MKKSDTELFSQELEFPEASRIDVIGQNGNDGLHYPIQTLLAEKRLSYQPTVFALQSMFSYGWDFVGFDDDDGLREVFKTEEEALIELNDICHFTGTPKEEWRVVPYNPYEDETFARY